MVYSCNAGEVTLKWFLFRSYQTKSSLELESDYSECIAYNGWSRDFWWSHVNLISCSLSTHIDAICPSCSRCQT